MTDGFHHVPSKVFWLFCTNTRLAPFACLRCMTHRPTVVFNLGHVCVPNNMLSVLSSDSVVALKLQRLLSNLLFPHNSKEPVNRISAQMQR